MQNFAGLTVGDKWGPRERYKIVKMLGRGGMGVVFLAEDLELPRSVALKLIRPDYINNEKFEKRLHREYKLHARVGFHPNLVALLDVFDTEGIITLVLEYVDGPSLRNWMASTPLTDPRRRSFAIRFITQCLDALDTIHSCGIIHRDLKPDNILLMSLPTHQLSAKLMDFGIARLTLGEETRLTQDGGPQPGTPRYIAPEQIDGTAFGPISPATDIYAMGASAYEALSGEPPFKGEMVQVFQAHLILPVPPFVTDPADKQGLAIQAVLEKAMAKQPADRYASGRDFRKALLTAMDENPDEHSISILGRRRTLGDGRELSPQAQLPVVSLIPRLETSDAHTRVVGPEHTIRPESSGLFPLRGRGSVAPTPRAQKPKNDEIIETDPFTPSVPKARVGKIWKRFAVAAAFVTMAGFAPKLFTVSQKSDMGFNVHDVPEDWKQHLDKNGIAIQGGAVIMEIEKGGPSNLAGARVFDVIIEFGGRPVANAESLDKMIRATPPGTKVQVEILRGLADSNGLTPSQILTLDLTSKTTRSKKSNKSETAVD